MSIVLKESVESRTYREEMDSEHFERIFFIEGTDDPYVARAYGPQRGEEYGSDLIVVNRKLKIKKQATASQPGVVMLTVSYQDPDSANSDDDTENSYEWNTQSSSQHITRSPRGQTHYPASADVGDLIGANGDTIEGVDIKVPSLSLRYTKYFSSWTSSMMKTLRNATGKVNQSAWKDWAAEEVLFLGAVGRRKGTGRLQVIYDFLVEPNITFNVQVVSGSQTIDKKGHDYVWYTYLKRVDEDEGRVAHEIESAHVAHVYELANFSSLGLGS